MNRNLLIVAVVVLLGVVGSWYVLRSSLPRSQSGKSFTSESSQNTNPEASAGAVLAGKAAQIFDFTKSRYDEEIKSNKLIVLYFYASWCPICKEEVPKMYQAFDELTTDQVVGFRINYNDNSTDNDEKELARLFGIAYQHTKVFLKNNSRILKSPEDWDKQRYLDEINKALTQ